MKKAMLGLVMAVMLMGLVGCGETTSNEEKNSIVESEVETEVKVDVNGNIIEENSSSNNNSNDEQTVHTYYGEILSIHEDNIDVSTVTFLFRRNTGSGDYTITIPLESRFIGQIGKNVKVQGYGSDTYIQEIISVEIIEE